MQDVVRLTALYRESAYSQVRGSKADVLRFMKDGYCVDSEGDGLWTLKKPSAAICCVEFADGRVRNCDARDAILQYYQSCVLTQDLVDRFSGDFMAGKVRVSVDGNHVIIK